jgi:glycosyltransferase involved in cell wall biosynthesis
VDATQQGCPAPHRVLVVTADVLGLKLAGPAIRAWQMADRLAEEHQVTLLSTAPPAGRCSTRFEVTDTTIADVAALARWCDVMVVQGFVFHFAPDLRSTQATIVVDYYDALHIETLEFVQPAEPAARPGPVRAAVEVLDEQALRGDIFLCSSERQRDLWLGHLAAHGRLNPLTYRGDPNFDQLLTTVPFGVADVPPRHERMVLRGIHPAVPVDAELLLWAGGIYDWLDPLTLVRAVGALAPRRPRLRLFFLGAGHPNPAAVESGMVTRARQLSEELGLLDRVVVFNNGWVDYHDRQNYLLEADIGVSTHGDHLETEFSFRTRLLDYLWAGLPVVTNTGDDLARLVQDEDCGYAVPCGDVAALAEAIDTLLDDAPGRARAGVRSRVAGETFKWSTVLRPLVEFCRSPRRAADHTAGI